MQENTTFEGSTHNLIYKLLLSNAQLNIKIVKIEYPKKYGLDQIYKKLHWSGRNSIGKWLKEGYEIVIEEDGKSGICYKLQLKDGSVLVGKKE